MPSTFFSEIVFIITAAFVGGFLARTIKFPPVIGYITSGVLFGIIGKNFFDSYSSLIFFSQIGVSLLLFTLGFEISLDTLKKVNRKVILAGLLQVIITTLFLLPLLLFFQVRFEVAFLFSMLFSLSSTAVIVKLLEEKGLLNNFPGNNVFIFLLLQDLLIVPIIFLLPILFAKSFTPVLIFGFLLAAIKPLILFILILLLGKLFLNKILNVLYKYPSHELTILATIFLAALSIGLFQALGIPQSIAAFLAGLLISEQGRNMAPLSEIRPFRDVFLVLFFVMTGMLINFNYFAANFIQIFMITTVLLAVKFLVTYVILRFFKYSPSAGVFATSHLANIGEFAAVVGQIAFVSGYIRDEEYNLVLAIFILSLILIPFWIKYFRTVAEKLSRLNLLKGVVGKESNFSKDFKEEFEKHVIICGHGRVGKEVRAILDLAEVPYIVIDFNRKTISELNQVSKFAIYGDPTDEEVLGSAYITSAKVLVVALPDTFSQKKIIDSSLKANPDIIILCRSHKEEDRYSLINMGVNTIVVPELEAGLRIGAEVLDLFGVDPQASNSLIKRSRREHLL